MQAETHLPRRHMIVAPAALLQESAPKDTFVVFSGAGYYDAGMHNDKQAHARHGSLMGSLYFGTTRTFDVPTGSGENPNILHAIAQTEVTPEHLAALARNNLELTNAGTYTELSEALQNLRIQDFLPAKVDLPQIPYGYGAQ